MPRGRRPGITPEITAAVLAAVRVGAPLEVAAQAAGVSRSTFWDWMRKGDDGKTPYAEFSESVRRAEAEVHIVVVGAIRQAIHHNPELALRWMRMRWWRYYLDHSKVDMSLDVAQEAARIAEETGLTKEAIMDEVERILVATR
jgi:hypothetical protein